MLIIRNMDDDAFSFCGKSQSSKQAKGKTKEGRGGSVPVVEKEVKNWREMTYRFEKNLSSSPQRVPVYQSHYINQRISRIDEELTENIKRRIELQKKLYKEKQEARESENEKYFKQNHCKTDLEAAQTYANMEKKSQAINSMLKPEDVSNSYLRLVEQKQLKNKQYLSKIKPQQKKYLVPDQLRIQKLLRSATFPELPKCNLEKLESECQQLLLNSQHSDLHYILMVTNFHQQKYHNVRKHFREIQMYKIFESKAYWVACQAEFDMDSPELCLKLADRCMREISDLHLPRFVYLQARCYEKLGNFVNCVVCYNQVIKMRPKVAELYLERAMVYDKIGYPMEAKQDYIQFGTLEPRARQILRQKILVQQNEIKRKQMIKALAKIT